MIIVEVNSVLDLAGGFGFLPQLFFKCRSTWGGREGELGEGRVKAVHRIWEKLEGEPVLVSVQKH